MSRMRILFSALLMTLSACCLHGDEPYVLLRWGRGTKKLECRQIFASPGGRVTIETENGRLSYNPGQYLVAVIPRPREVDQLEELLDEERYNDVTTSAPGVFQKYCYLGWADVIAKMHCEGLMALKRRAEAEKFLRMAYRFPRLDDFNLEAVRLLLLVHDKKVDEVRSQLSKFMAVDNDALHAFVFNMRGRIAEISGDKQGAILQYLKTFLTFENRRKFRRFRKEAQENAVRLMQEIGDPTAKVVAGMK